MAKSLKNICYTILCKQCKSEDFPSFIVSDTTYRAVRLLVKKRIKIVIKAKRDSNRDLRNRKILHQCFLEMKQAVNQFGLQGSYFNKLDEKIDQCLNDISLDESVIEIYKQELNTLRNLNL